MKHEGTLLLKGNVPWLYCYVTILFYILCTMFADGKGNKTQENERIYEYEEI